MTSISLCDLLTIIFVLVDDWYQHHGIKLLKGKAGAKPVFTDSEVITLMIAQDFIPYPGETQYIEFMRANHLPCFPSCWIRASSIGVLAHYGCWSSNCGATGCNKKAGIGKTSSCWTPNQSQWWATNATSSIVISLGVPTTVSVPAVICTTSVTKMTSHLLRHLLRLDFGVNVQRFEMITSV